MVIGDGSGYQLEERDGEVTLVVTDSWTPKMDRLIESGRASGVDLNYAKGFKNTDLNFIQEWPLKRVSILARTVKDLRPLERLSATLETLSVQTDPAAALDLNVFPRLRSLAAHWEQIRESVGEAPHLLDLLIRSFDQRDLSPLRWNSSLTRIRFKDRSRLRCLEGIERLPGLVSLGVYVAPLDDLSRLSGSGVQLRELEVESCPIHDLAPLSRQDRLRSLNASECGEILSVKPIGKLTELESVWLFGTTRVVDNDLSPLAELPRLAELRMQSRRSYRPSVSEIHEAISKRMTQ